MSSKHLKRTVYIEHDGVHLVYIEDGRLELFYDKKEVDKYLNDLKDY